MFAGFKYDTIACTYTNLDIPCFILVLENILVQIIHTRIEIMDGKIHKNTSRGKVPKNTQVAKRPAVIIVD